MAGRMILYFDGGARVDPARMEIAVVTGGVAHIRDDVGTGDSGTAEWLALRFAVALAVAAGAVDVLLIGDARAVVEQASGRWPCRSPRSKAQCAAYREAIAAIPRVTVRHVRRSKNLAGVALARRYPR